MVKRIAIAGLSMLMFGSVAHADIKPNYCANPDKNVMVQHNGTWGYMKADTKLHDGDKIRTGTKSCLTVQYGTLCQVFVPDSSTYVVDSTKSCKTVPVKKLSYGNVSAIMLTSGMVGAAIATDSNPASPD